MTSGKKLLFATTSVLTVYAGSFATLWIGTRSPTAPKPSISENDLEVLRAAEVVLTHYVGIMQRNADSSSELVKDLDERVQRISQDSGRDDWFGNAANELLSDAELVRNDQRELETAQRLVLQQVKLCLLLSTGLREAMQQRVLVKTGQDIEQWTPKIEKLIEQADRNITTTKIGLAIDPSSFTAPARYEWNSLVLLNIEQQGSISSIKDIHADVTKAAETLKQLAKNRPPAYHTFKFPF